MIAAELVGGPADGELIAVENGSTVVNVALPPLDIWVLQENDRILPPRVGVYLLDESTLKTCPCMPCTAVSRIDPKRAHSSGKFLWQGEQ